nr:hypothetical protein [Tanacetum cinerariifolium]
MAADPDSHHVGSRDAGKLRRPARGHLYPQALELWPAARRCRQGAAGRQDGLGSAVGLTSFQHKTNDGLGGGFIVGVVQLRLA